MDKQAIIKELQRRASSGHPDAQIIQTEMQKPEFQALSQQQQVMTSNPTLDALIQKAIQPQGVRQNIGNAISMLGGGNPTAQQDDISKLYAQEAIKKQFENPLDSKIKDLRYKTLEAGLDTDEEGNPIKAVDPQKAEREKRLREFEGRKQASGLRGELNQNDYVKRFQAMNPAVQGIDVTLQDALSRPDNKSKNISDQAIITLYNKVLDPLSVVRESEYARTPQGLALMDRIQGFVEKVKAGGSGLTDQDRIEVARAAKTLVNESGKTYNSKIDDYSHLADEYAVDPQMVIGGYEKFNPYDVNKQYQIGTPQAQVPQQVGQAPQSPEGELPPEIAALVAKGHKIVGVRNG